MLDEIALIMICVASGAAREKAITQANSCVFLWQYEIIDISPDRRRGPE
jgi:hypothetical protein